MSIVDDPMLALILRFVLEHEQMDVSNEAFIQRQIESLKCHVAQFPEELQEPKAMEWIEQHAENYRRTWQRTVVSDTAVNRRCMDCPLIQLGDPRKCAVHDDWLALLDRYQSKKLTSAEYVEDALTLLQGHKSELVVSLLKDGDKEGASAALYPPGAHR